MAFVPDAEPPLAFTQVELQEQQKTSIIIQQDFQRHHVEITAPSNSDMATMIRQEKQMYANMGIAFAVAAMMAMEKRKKK